MKEYENLSLNGVEIKRDPTIVTTMHLRTEVELNRAITWIGNARGALKRGDHRGCATDIAACRRSLTEALAALNKLVGE